ncbi:MAG: DnaJ domain-containing protein [Acidobacteriota bacterium]
MESALHKDFYAVLGVPRDANAKAIKLRFRELARERHPDRFQGDEKLRAEEDFQNVTEAFNVLMDPVRRRQVDLFLARPKKARHDPDDLLRVYLNRGIRAFKQEQWIEAASNFDRATQTDPRSPQAWHHLAMAASKQERWLPKAREAIDKACELRSDHVPYLKLAGKIYAMSGMTPKAKQYYNQAMRLAGSDASIRKALEALGGPSAEQGAASESESEAKPGLFRKMKW